MDIDGVLFEDLLFKSPFRDFDKDYEESIRLKAMFIGKVGEKPRTIYTNEIAYWEPKNLEHRMKKKLGEIKDIDIDEIEITGLTAPTVVIDELFDCLGRFVKSGLKRLKINFSDHDQMKELSYHVFDVLGDKCTNLTRFELYGTKAIKDEAGRKVIHKFFDRVVEKSGTNLADLRLIDAGRE